MDYDLSMLELGIKKFGLELSQRQRDQFAKYMLLLIEWNKKMNLTAIVEPKQIIIEHFLDSLAILPLIELKPESTIIDIGTGAGLPGIPIKIMNPKIGIVLLDSLRKRTEFLNVVKEELGLDSLTIVHSRAEDGARADNYREGFDIVLSRAVAPLNVLSEYCLPFVKPGGLFLSYKGPGALEELKNAQRAITILGGEMQAEIKEVRVPGLEKTRNLVLIRKTSSSPKKYPRSPGKAKKNPL